MNVIRMYLGLVVMCICTSLISGAMSWPRTTGTSTEISIRSIRWAAPGLRVVILQPHWEILGALEAAERYAAIRHRHGLHLHCYAVLPGT